MNVFDLLQDQSPSPAPATVVPSGERSVRHRSRKTEQEQRHLQRLDNEELGLSRLDASARYHRGYSARISKTGDFFGATNSIIKATHRDRNRNPLVAFVALKGAALMLDTPAGDALRAEAVELGFRVTRFSHTRRDGSVSEMGWILWWDNEEATEAKLRSWFVLADTSAAKRNRDGDNDFIRGMMTLLANHPCEQWDPGDEKRAVRDDMLTTGLVKILQRNGVSIFLDGELLDATDLKDRRDIVRSFEASSRDRKNILGALNGGEVNAAFHNQLWPDDPATLPLGITVPPDPERGHRGGGRPLVLLDDEAMAAALPHIKAIVESTGWMNMSYPQIAAKLGALGVTTPRLVREHGAGATLADGSPYVVVKTVWGWVDAWARNAVPWRITWPLTEENLGRTDLVREEFEDGTFILKSEQWIPFPECTFGLDRSTLVAAAANVKARQKRDRLLRGSRTEVIRDRAMPASYLCGWEEKVNGKVMQFKLFARPGSYVLRCRPKPGPGEKRSWQSNRGRVVCSVTTAELHAILARGMRNAFTGQSALTYVAPRTGAVASSDVRVANSAAAQARRNEIDIAIRGAKIAEMKADEQRAILLEDGLDRDREAAARSALAEFSKEANEYRTAAARLEREAIELEEAGDIAEEDTDTFDVSTPFALAELLEREDVTQLPKPALAALRSTVSDLRLVRAGLFVDVSFEVKGSSDRSEVVFQRVTDRAENTSRTDSEGNFGARHDRGFELARLFMTSDRSIVSLADEFNKSVPYMSREVRKYLSTLIPSRGRLSALIAHPLWQDRALLWAALHDESLPEWADETDAAWAPHLKAVYTSPLPWGQNWVLDCDIARRVLVAVDRYATDAERGLSVAEIEEYSGVPVRRINELVSTKHGVPAVLQRVSEWTTSHGAPYSNRARARVCPGCKSRPLFAVQRVPELPGVLVCPDCMIEPGSPDRRIPARLLERQWVPVVPGDEGYIESVPTVRLAE